MEKLMTKQNFMYAGIGILTAFIVYKVLVNREKSVGTTKPVSKSVEETSDFCGCGAQLIYINVCGIINKKLKLSQRTWTCENGHKLNRDLNASINLEKLAVSSTESAFGDKSSVGVNPIQLVDELGRKHQMFTFV